MKTNNTNRNYIEESDKVCIKQLRIWIQQGKHTTNHTGKQVNISTNTLHCLEEQNNKKQLKQIKTANPSATGEQTQQVKAKNEYCFKYPRTRKERPTECARCDEHFYTSES